MQAYALAASSNSLPFSQHYPPTHTRLFHNLFLGREKEYSRITHALAPFSPTPTSSDTTLTLTALHPNLNGHFSFFLKDTNQTKTSNFLLIPSN